MIRKAARNKQLQPHEVAVVTQAPGRARITHKKSAQEVAQDRAPDRAIPVNTAVGHEKRLEEKYTCADPANEQTPTPFAIKKHKRLRRVIADLHQRQVEAMECRDKALRRSDEMVDEEGAPRELWPNLDDYPVPDYSYESPLSRQRENAWVRLRNFERKHPEVLCVALRDEHLSREEWNAMNERLHEIRVWQRLAARWREGTGMLRYSAVIMIYKASCDYYSGKKHKSLEKDTGIRVIFLDEEQLLAWWPWRDYFKLVDRKGLVSDLCYIDSDGMRADPHTTVEFRLV